MEWLKGVNELRRRPGNRIRTDGSTLKQEEMLLQGAFFTGSNEDNCQFENR